MSVRRLADQDHVQAARTVGAELQGLLHIGRLAGTGYEVDGARHGLRFGAHYHPRVLEVSNQAPGG